MTSANYIALTFSLAILFYAVVRINQHGIARDLLRETDQDKEALLLIIGSCLIAVGVVMLCVNLLGSGSTVFGGGIAMLTGNQWINKTQQTKVTTAQIAATTTTTTTKTPAVTKTTPTAIGNQGAPPPK